MAGPDTKKNMKSLGGNKPLRSRGFLSQPGGQAQTASGAEGDASDAKAHHRSRGARQVSVSKDSQPESLDSRPFIKPYTLEDK
jgi:hypothetical protein